MEEEKYQIDIKANYINLLLLEDELKHFDLILSKPIKEMLGWVEKLRTTRSVFLTLYNIKDVTSKLRIQSPNEYVVKTKALRKKLELANHIRNKGIGHLDTTLLKRAVQWNPLMFVKTGKETEELRLADAHRAVLESCINSYIDNDGVQKEFGHEVDLFYPKDTEEFYGYLNLIVQESLDWLSDSKEILSAQIKYHSIEDIFELSSVAAATNFDLKGKSDLSFCKKDSKNNIKEGLEKLVEHGVSPEAINLIKNKYEI
ncbi:hypothetical protein LMH66_14395 [Shewanella sp. 10N.7]|uniref:hypothetical protein n=1 Tax=Shewanella sp. 10N.7 TaxID=2885093 RepID=UPI001E37F244|nr:hypothetical protein [Shewanella sp. 10N.7]MCC4833830.1 hypothetical protein [Shewanella sp. 10N.7]